LFFAPLSLILANYHVALGNTEILVLIELWKEHSEAPFPNGYGGKDVNGICVTPLDSNASGCIHSYMRNDTYDMSLEHYQILQNLKSIFQVSYSL
jgi:hypothetical protein